MSISLVSCFKHTLTQYCDSQVTQGHDYTMSLTLKPGLLATGGGSWAGAGRGAGRGAAAAAAAAASAFRFSCFSASTSFVSSVD